MVQPIVSSLGFSLDIPHVEKKEKSSSYLAAWKITDFKIPFQGLSSLFGSLGEFSLSNGLKQRIHDSLASIKTYRSTFSLPLFFKYLFKSYDNTKVLNNQCQLGSNQKTYEVAIKTINDGLSLISNTGKVAILMNKLEMIDMSQIGEEFPDKLDKFCSILSFFKNSLKLYINSLLFMNCLYKEPICKLHQKIIEDKKLHAFFKLLSTVVKLALSILNNIGIFLGIVFSPVLFLTLGVASFCLSLISFFYSKKKIFPLVFERPNINLV